MSIKDYLNICDRRKSKMFLVVDISEQSDKKLLNSAVRKCIHDAKYSSIACDISLSIDVLVFNSTAKWICKDEDINTYEWHDLECMGDSEPGAAFNELDEKINLYYNTLKFNPVCILPSIILISDYDKSATYFEKVNKLFSNVWFRKAFRIGIASKNKKTSLLLSFATSEETVLFADNLNTLKDLISFPEIYIEWLPDEIETIDSLTTICKSKSVAETMSSQSSVSQANTFIPLETEDSKNADETSLIKIQEDFYEKGEADGKTEDELDAEFELIMKEYYENPERNEDVIKCYSDERKLVEIMEAFYEKGEADGKTEDELDAEFELILQKYYEDKTNK